MVQQEESVYARQQMLVTRLVGDGEHVGIRVGYNWNGYRMSAREGGPSGRDTHDTVRQVGLRGDVPVTIRVDGKIYDVAVASPNP